MPKSPAEKAGLKTGDVIVKVNTEDVSHTKPVSDAINVLGGPAGKSMVCESPRRRDPGHGYFGMSKFISCVSKMYFMAASCS